MVEVRAERASKPPIAAVDCGTNTIKLLIGSMPEVLVRESTVVRLGQGVDRTGRLADEALARTFEAVERYAALCREHGVERIRFCATSATRDSSNADEFADGVEQRLGVRPEVLSGEEEAALSFDGAVRHLRHQAETPVLVVDIGGGSTELILGSDRPDRAHSMDVGSVRLHERHVDGDPPTEAEVAAVVADIDAALDACPVDPAAAATVVGVAGTITTLAAAVLDLPEYDRDAIDQSVLAVDDVHACVDRLLGMTVVERKALPFMHPGRADVIGVGALILDRVLRRAEVPSLVVSESDILDGIAWSLT